jgi:hypothetical protein
VRGAGGRNTRWWGRGILGYGRWCGDEEEGKNDLADEGQSGGDDCEGQLVRYRRIGFRSTQIYSTGKERTKDRNGVGRGKGRRKDRKE